jgi:hypothetical protein
VHWYRLNSACFGKFALFRLFIWAESWRYRRTSVSTYRGAGSPRKPVLGRFGCFGPVCGPVWRVLVRFTVRFRKCGFVGKNARKSGLAGLVRFTEWGGRRGVEEKHQTPKSKLPPPPGQRRAGQRNFKLQTENRSGSVYGPVAVRRSLCCRGWVLAPLAVYVRVRSG